MNELKKIETDDGAVNPPEIIPESIDGKPISEVGGWDTETARTLASEDFNRSHNRKIEKLGEQAIADQGIDTTGMAKEKIEALARQLGDELFHKMAREEQARDQVMVDDRMQKGREVRERSKRTKEAEDKKPLKVIGDFFREMFYGKY